MERKTETETDRERDRKTEHMHREREREQAQETSIEEFGYQTPEVCLPGGPSYSNFIICYAPVPCLPASWPHLCSPTSCPIAEHVSIRLQWGSPKLGTSLSSGHPGDPSLGVSHLCPGLSLLLDFWILGSRGHVHSAASPGPLAQGLVHGRSSVGIDW